MSDMPMPPGAPALLQRTSTPPSTPALLPQTPGIAFGGDYAPEQWSREVWTQDYAAFDAAGITTLTVGVFTWALTQPDEDTFDFSVLDEIISRAAAEGRSVCLGTGTGALPPWLARKHPDVTRTDFEGRHHRYGQRHNACWSSPAYRRLAADVAGRLAERYGSNPAVVAWHVGNEYGGRCYCPRCAGEFRLWLQRRYGTLDRLNEAWNTTFWSHRFTAWEEIEPPNALTEHWRGPGYTAFQGITLDYARFSTDNAIRQFSEEKAAIRRYSDRPVTTNFMGLYEPLDYHRWASHLDFASWDNYPRRVDEPWAMSLAHDLMRGLKDGAPFWLMEQTPSMTASRDVNPVRRPGVMRLWSWQAVAHGADAVLFFQMRASRGACEMTHGAVLDHSGSLDTRTFREVAALGDEIARVGAVIRGARTRTRCALIIDWDSWWAVEMADGPNRLLRYLPTVQDWARAFWDAGAQLDVVSPAHDLRAYDVVAAPLLHMLRGDVVDRLTAVAERGGTVVIGCLSGRVDEDDRRFLAAAPGPLAALAGVRVAETDAAEPGRPCRVLFDGSEASGSLLFEVLAADDADVVARYGDEFYAGKPAVTRRDTGEGDVWYIGTQLDRTGLAHVFRQVLGAHGLLGPYAEVEGLELTSRITPRGERIDFLLHHGPAAVTIRLHTSGTDLLTGLRHDRGAVLVLHPTDVMVLSTSSASSE